MPSIKNENVLKGSMQEKIMQFVTKLILQEKKVYSIVLAICRYESAH